MTIFGITITLIGFFGLIWLITGHSGCWDVIKKIFNKINFPYKFVNKRTLEKERLINKTDKSNMESEKYTLKLYYKELLNEIIKKDSDILKEFGKDYFEKVIQLVNFATFELIQLYYIIEDYENCYNEIIIDFKNFKSIHYIDILKNIFSKIENPNRILSLLNDELQKCHTQKAKKEIMELLEELKKLL